MVLQRFQEPQFQNHGFIRFDQERQYAQRLIAQYDVRSGQGPVTIVRSMSGGNQQKAIVARGTGPEYAPGGGGAAHPRPGCGRH